MQLHTFKSRSLAEALRLVRAELGPDASVLHTREIGSPLMRLLGGRVIEVTASAELAAPSRLPQHETGGRSSCRAEALKQDRIPRADEEDFRRKIGQDVLVASKTEASLVEQLASTRTRSPHSRFPGAASIAQRLRRAGMSDETTARWLDRLEAELVCDPDCHTDRLLNRLRQIIAAELSETILPSPSADF
jgi:flagellar biosynthesis GTPase FlhF